MLTRIWAGLVAAAIAVGVLILGGVAVPIMAGVMGLLCCHEMCAAWRAGGRKPFVYLALAYMPPLIVCAWFGGLGAAALLLTCFTLVSLALPMWRKDRDVLDGLCTVLPMVYVGMPMACLTLLFRMPYGYNYMGLLLALCCAFFSDIAAYFCGSFFGKHKLCPTISPNKTVEGSVCGLLGGVLAALLLGLFLQAPFQTKLPVWGLLLLGLACAAISQIGDLVASSIKRYVGIKDFGKLIPGHGGMLDRIDGVLFTLPVVYFAFTYVFTCVS